MFTLRLSIFRTFSVGFRVSVEFWEMFQSGRRAVATPRPRARGTAVNGCDSPLLLFLQDARHRDLHCGAVSADSGDPERSWNSAAFDEHSHPGHADAPAPSQLARCQGFELGLLSGHSRPFHGRGAACTGSGNSEVEADGVRTTKRPHGKTSCCGTQRTATGRPGQHGAFGVGNCQIEIRTTVGFELAEAGNKGPNLLP